MTAGMNTAPSGFGRVARRAGRGGVGLGMAAAGVAVLVGAHVVRATEASFAAVLVGSATTSSTYVAKGSSSFYWLMGTSDARGLRITPECSIAYVVGPLLVISGLLALIRRLPLRRVALAAVVAGVVIAAVNLLRIVMVALAVTRYPSERAMWWWHVVIGSLVSLGGIGVGLALLVRITFGSPSRHRPGRSATS